MTDDELLTLVQSKSPEELTAEEIAQLRAGLATSESLRTALFETLQMEAYLAAALSPVQLQAEEIVERAHQFRQERLKTWTWVVGIVGIAAFLVLSFGVLRSALNLGETEVVVVLPQPEKVVAPVNPGDDKPAEAPAVIEVPPEEKPPAKVEEPPPENEPEDEVPATGPQPTDPWYAVVNLPADELPNFADVCFDDFPYRSVLPRRETVNQWFEAVAGRNYRVIDADTKKGKCGKIEGFTKLRAPLPEDGGVRFAIEDYNRLGIHVYHQNQGVLLLYYEEPRPKWVAYAVTRNAGESKFETLVTTATDDERARRAEVRYGGPLELRYHEGELLLLRGDIALVRAPLPGPPEDIYFEGKATFEGISLVRTQDFPLAKPADAPVVKYRPADLVWTEKVSEGAKLEKGDDGSLRLTSREPKEPSYLFAPVPGLGYREVIFEITDAAPGFGVCLSPAEGMVREVARLVRNTRTKRLNVVFQPNNDFSEGELPPLNERTEYSPGSTLWVKLLHGNGCLKWWLSADGMHWAIGEAVENSPGQIAALGITTCRTKNESGGTLRSISVRELPALNALAERALLEIAPSHTKHITLEAWQAAVIADCPAGVNIADWRRACAIRSLGDGLTRNFAEQLLETLLDDPATRALPLEAQHAALRETMMVSVDPRDAAVWKIGFMTRLHQLGHRFAAAGGLPFTSVRRTLMEAPVWTPHTLQVAHEGQAEEELVLLLQQGRTEEALALCRLLRLYHFHENRPLFAWAEATARRDTGRVTGDIARSKESWRHPLVEELNKEVYNFAADLHSIVESGAMDDASRMIASLEADRGGGLTPSGGDRDLFVSLSVAVKLAIAQQPALRTELNDRLGPLAQLRIRQAISGGDEAAITLAATQFDGTEAASEAYRWLGDRALQNGWFERALAEYRRAEVSASTAQSRELAPRARLAAAMMGSDYGSVVTDTVSFGEVKMAPGDFEALVAEMRARGTGGLQGAASAAITLPGPTLVQATNRARFDGPMGQNPHDDGAPRISQWQIDYAGRQLASAVEGDLMYVSNRFQIAAYNATNGQRLWQSQTPSGETRRTQDWALIPMKPLLTSSAIYARLLYGHSPSLVCFEKAGGKKLWQREGTENEWWASDPVFVQGQLIALNVLREGNREMQLRLVSLDPLTGEILVQRRLLSLRESWRQRRMCEITSLDDGLIATLGGITLSCDASGSVRWVRKQLLLPSEERPEWVTQYFAPPLIVDSRIIALQPGVEALECLDAATGRELWTYSADRPRRILGRSGDRVVIETDSGILALNVADGQVAWRFEETSPRLTAALANDQYVVYAVKRGASDKPKTPALVWLDATNGRYLGSAEFPQWVDNDPRIGPLLATKDRLWTFYSKEKDPNKDLVELVPGGPVAQTDPLATDPWQRNLSSTWRETVHQLAPQWQIASGYPRKDLEKKTAWQGESDSLLVQSRTDMPAMLFSQVKLPADKKPKLNLKVGHEGHPPGQFTVRVDGETIFTQEWKPEGANRWDTLSLDLAKFAGRDALISLVYQPSTGNDHGWWIKSAQVQLE